MHDHIKKLLDRFYATKDANTRFTPTNLVSLRSLLRHVFFLIDCIVSYDDLLGFLDSQFTAVDGSSYVRLEECVVNSIYWQFV